MTLLSLSPLDGRYREKVIKLSEYFSEAALMKYRVTVEVEFFIALSLEPKIKEVRKFTKGETDFLRNLYLNFSQKDAERIKTIEKTTNHDVKAVEYFIKEKIAKIPLEKYSEFIHFACTSEDINNLSYALMLKDSIKSIILPVMNQVYKDLLKKSKTWKKISLLARTHGQTATPTTVGKEFFVFTKRLERQIEKLKKQEYLGKFSGATGTFAAHHIAYPEINWIQFSTKFIKSLKLTPNSVTTQIESHDFQAEIYHNISRFNTICTDLTRDIWLYISQGYFSQKLKEGEVGSSTMPHKVNPIDFENAEGNLGIANSLLIHLANTLPISRLQRDLTDSTVQRNIGSAFGYSLLAYTSLLKGLGKLKVNHKILKKDLDENLEVLAEALQTVMRRYGIEKPYEKLKKLTRGKRITRQDLDSFIDSLALPKSEKLRLKKLTPDKYIGLAEKLVK